MKKKHRTLRNYLRGLKKLQQIHDKHWNSEFKERFTTSHPEIPLPEPEMEPIVNLGCLNGGSINDLVTVSLSWPIDFAGRIQQYALLDQIAETGLYTNPNVDFPSVPLYGSINSETDWNIIQQQVIGNAPYAQGTTSIDQSTVDAINRVFNIQENSIECDAICQGGDTSYQNVFLSQPSPVPNPPSVESLRFNNLSATDEQVVRARRDYINRIFGQQNNTIPSAAPFNWPLESLGNGVEGVLVSNVLNGITSVQTPFQNNVYLTSNINLYTDSSVSEGYTPIPLSQEGLLWTLWPLSRTTQSMSCTNSQTYFDGFQFGTATRSQYAIGQLAYFINNRQIGCVPLNNLFPVGTNASVNPTDQINDLIPVGPSLNSIGISNPNQPFVEIVTGRSENPNQFSLGLTPGIQGLNSTLITTTKQMVALVVIKVTEQVARIPNPAEGVGSIDRFIYVGYDGWSVVRTTMNPLAPLAAQTYVTPQSVTGSVVGDNYQVIFPPNFPQAIFYKNYARSAPTNTEDGLFMGAPFAHVNTQYRASNK